MGEMGSKVGGAAPGFEPGPPISLQGPPLFMFSLPKIILEKC